MRATRLVSTRIRASEPGGDLLEVLSDFGASAKIKLNEICAALGLPGKTGTDGGDVMVLFDAGEVQAIRDYCETDVLNTYGIYLHFELIRGRLSPEAHQQAIEHLVGYLKEQSQKSHLREFLEQWQRQSF